MKTLRLSACITSLVLAVGFILVTALVASAQGPSSVTASSIQSMTYEVYAGGINAVTANLDVSFEANKRYSFKFSAKTQGFLGKLAPWEGSFETEGWALEDGSTRPEMHKSVSVWRSESEVKEYNYRRDGSFEGLVITEEGKVETKEIDSELTQQTTDALTATLEIMKQVAAGGTCEGTSEIFDGKRRYALSFSYDSEEILKPTRYNAYEGNTVRCTVEVKPVAGNWHKKPRGWMSIQEQGRLKGDLPTVWFASISEGAPAIPVKVRVKTDFGTLFMHLTQYNDGNQTKISKKH